jgi:hypothetical protein
MHLKNVAVSGVEPSVDGAGKGFTLRKNVCKWI